MVGKKQQHNKNRNSRAVLNRVFNGRRGGDDWIASVSRLVPLWASLRLPRRRRVEGGRLLTVLSPLASEHTHTHEHLLLFFFFSSPVRFHRIQGRSSLRAFTSSSRYIRIFFPKRKNERKKKKNKTHEKVFFLRGKGESLAWLYTRECMCAERAVSRDKAHNSTDSTFFSSLTFPWQLNLKCIRLPLFFKKYKTLILFIL